MEERNVVLVYVFGIITFGIYFIYWFVKTKNEMNEAGADIPTAWFLIIPIVNFYWLYKYVEGYSTQIRKDDNVILWFIVAIVFSFILPALIQPELNKLATAG